MNFVFPWTSIDSVVGGLNRQVEKLEALVTKHTANAATYGALAKRLQDKGREQHDEAVRARRLADKFKDLVA